MAAPTTGDDYRSCHKSRQRDVCLVHGGRIREIYPGVWRCQTWAVLRDVQAERARQYARYGTNDNMEYGTGPDVKWVAVGGDAGEQTAADVQIALRVDYEQYAQEHGLPTWMHLIREEVAEAFAEADLARLREEAIQVAALCVSMIEKIDARGGQAR